MIINAGITLTTTGQILFELEGLSSDNKDTYLVSNNMTEKHLGSSFLEVDTGNFYKLQTPLIASKPTLSWVKM